jgi:hypothetical protein
MGFISELTYGALCGIKEFAWNDTTEQICFGTFVSYNT